MNVAVKIFALLAFFFILVGAIYGLLTGGEAVGMGALMLSGGLAAMIGFYLMVVSRRSGPMPGDDPFGEIADGAGQVGVFAPWSWWPLVAAAAAALVFMALAIGLWMLVPAVVLGVIGLVGWLLEFSRGQHAH